MRDETEDSLGFFVRGTVIPETSQHGACAFLASPLPITTTYKRGMRDITVRGFAKVSPRTPALRHHAGPPSESLIECISASIIPVKRKDIPALLVSQLPPASRISRYVTGPPFLAPPNRPKGDG